MAHCNHCFWVLTSLETFPGGDLKQSQELGEGLTQFPEMYQITKHFLLVCYAPGVALAIGNTKMMAYLISNPCLFHLWA